jgi:hypothetical protein
MKALIDGDIVCYRCAASAENDPVDIAISRMHGMVEEALQLTNADYYSMYLSGSNNFRYQLYPEYKANRKDKERPKHLEVLKEHLIKGWNAKVSDGCEADDLIGCDAGEDTIIVSIDKDLRQIPGMHYNLVKKVKDEVDQHQAWFNFYSQLILGDRSDNILGYDGKMRNDIPKFLQSAFDSLYSCHDELGMFDQVYHMYMSAGREDQLELTGQLLYIWRKENDSWDFNKLKQEMEHRQSSSETLDMEQDPSLVHI